MLECHHSISLSKGSIYIIQKIWQLITATFKAWQEDDVSLIAAALSYYTIFSLAPLLVIVIAIAGVFFGQASVESEIVAQFGDLLGEETANLLNTMIEAFQSLGSGVLATVISLSLLLFGATNLFFQLEKALNTIWNVDINRDDETSGAIPQLIQKRLLSFVFILLLGVLLIISLLINSALSAFIAFIPAEQAWLSRPLQFSNILISVTVLTLNFALIYKYLPDTHIDWQDVWVGALVTSVLFTVGQLAIGFYIGQGTTTSAYGAAGSLAALLLWVYYSMQILLLGAEFTQVYSHQFRSTVGIGSLPQSDD
ncbi:MAG: YihY/virulence factor BrkB family protein [Anaerolineae bacterium]